MAAPTNKTWNHIEKRYKHQLKDQGAFRFVDTSQQKIASIIKWLIIYTKRDKPFIWGDVNTLCIPMTNNKLGCCHQSKHIIEHLLSNHPFIQKHIFWYNCIDHTHIEHSKMVNAQDNPRIYKDYVRMIKTICAQGNTFLDTKCYPNAISCYKQALKRSKEIHWRSLQMERKAKVYIYNKLFNVYGDTEWNNIYYLIKYYKKIYNLYSLSQEYELKRIIIKSKSMITASIKLLPWKKSLCIQWKPLNNPIKIQTISYNKIIITDNHVLKYLSKSNLFFKIKQRIINKHCGHCLKYNTINKGKTSNNKKCKRCRMMYYCSRRCQKLHWKQEHKKKCVQS